ncbi:DNA primase [Sphingobium sp. CR28]|uniref:DNA primase n=1 Tax=Sphingobium sp. CR28 TaxID=3400272 RepID=UPI003FEE1BAF
MSLTPQWLDQLRSRTTLSTLIGKSVKVIRAGREHKACCPFHNEKTPSFTINDEKGFYHCFGCGAHGDAIRWMTDHQGLPFMEAVKELADAAGMEVPAPDPKAAKRAEQARSLHDVMAAARDWFETQLGGLDGAGAREYLKRRGISDETRRAFGIGFAPDSRGKLKTALRDFPETMLVESGMLIAPEDKSRESYDRFRGRVMIPIADQRGRVIAFGGRILDSGEPKYLNSPETPLFDKGRTLYNLDKAAPAARKTGRIVVVEGYMDVIALAQAGLAEAVAPLGTALTEAQIEKLWTMVATPLLCFDGDAAGQRAAMRAAHRALPLLRPGHSLAFATLPAGQDPDDLVRTGGLSAMDAVLAASRPLSDTLWEVEKASGLLETPEQRAGLKQRLDELTDTIRHEDIRAHYRRHFRERLDALFFSRPERRPFVPPAPGGGGRSGQRWSPPPPPPSVEARAIHIGGIELPLLRAVIGALLRHPQEIRRHRETLAHLDIADSRLAGMVDKLVDLALDEETVETERLLTILGQGEVYNMAKELLRADALHFTVASKTEGDGAPARIIDEAMMVMVAMPRIDAELAAATRAMMGEAVDGAAFEAGYVRQQDLRRRKAELEARLSELIEPQDV